MWQNLSKINDRAYKNDDQKLFENFVIVAQNNITSHMKKIYSPLSETVVSCGIAEEVDGSSIV